MLSDKNVAATIAVKDLAVAKKFYGSTLGLTQVSENSEAVIYYSGSATLMVYRSQLAGTNRATAATWDVGDEMDAILRDLKKAGVAFEHYDMPGLRREGDLHIAEGVRAAWFKDPDGNILALTQV